MFGVTEKVLAHFFPEPGSVLNEFIALEKKYFGPVQLKEGGPLRDMDLRFAESPAEVMENRLAEKESLIRELQSQNDRFKESIAWYRSTYETRSWAGLLLTRFFKKG